MSGHCIWERDQGTAAAQTRHIHIYLDPVGPEDLLRDTSIVDEKRSKNLQVGPVLGSLDTTAGLLLLTNDKRTLIRRHAFLHRKCVL